MNTPRYRWPRRAAAAGLALLLLAGEAIGDVPEPRQAARVRPPAALDCPRDRLTMYAGQVQRYRREAGRTVIRIRTDWETTEEVIVSHPGTDDPAAWFLIEGRRFEQADWPRIEQRPRSLRAGMRAAAWVCGGGGNPVVDWNPPRER